MATPDRARSWVAIGAVSPTAVIRRMKPRLDIRPAFTWSKRPRKSRSSIGCLPCGVECRNVPTPHPEEPCEAERLEGWATASLLPPFETRTSCAPCIKNRPRRRRLGGAVSAESPYAPRAGKPVPERGASAVDFVIPNGRLGRTVSPHAQGWEPKSMFVGIDVAKDRLDVHVPPAGESFVVARDGDGIEELAKRLNPMTPTLVVLEGTGGFET